MTTIMSTMSYTTICSTNPASLVVVEYCSTFTVPDCGCDTQTQPEIPVATVVNTCDACGAAGESVVTLTVPVMLVADATADAAAVAEATADAADVADATANPADVADATVNAAAVAVATADAAAIATANAAAGATANAAAAAAAVAAGTAQPAAVGSDSSAAKVTVAANASPTSSATSGPYVVVNAAAGILAMNKELVATVLVGTFSLYLAVLL